MLAESNDQLVTEFTKAGIAKLSLSISGARFTTMSVGGPIKYLVEPSNIHELIRCLVFFKNQHIKYRVLGAGSNLVISDTGVSEWVIRLGRGFRFFNQLDSLTFEIGASMPLIGLARKISEAALSGLEFASGIPASIGGAVRMNAGAHDGEVVDVLDTVSFVTSAGDLNTINAKELNWSYRSCSLATDAIVTSVTARFVASNREKVVQKRNACLTERKLRQPLHYPSAGSVFKNPKSSEAAGYLIEAVGLKGKRYGGAQISNMHANWIVNPKRAASASDVTALVEAVKLAVEKQFGCRLEPELIFW